MNKPMTAKPNQSLADMTLSEYGTLEAVMAAAYENDVPISHIPNTGDVLNMPDSDQTAPDEVAYLQRNNIEIGTLARGALEMEVVLKPGWNLVPNAIGNPHTMGYYSFDMVADGSFIHTNPLATTYAGDNGLYYISEERHVAGHGSEWAVPISATLLPALSVPYVLPWTAGLGYMIVYSDLSQVNRSITVKDTAGNEAFCAPVNILDNVTQDVIEKLQGDISVEVVSSGVSSIRLRLTRTHAAIVLGDFATRRMRWLYDALRGTPDPDDPTNANKTILELGPGTYTLGIITTYYFTLVTPNHAFPSSASSMVIHIK